MTSRQSSTAVKKVRAGADAAAKVRAYLAKLPPKTRQAVVKLGTAIRAAAPGATHGYSYAIPSILIAGKPVFWYAAWKEHTSMYPLGEAFAKTHGIDLEGYELSKGTIRFPLAKPIPVALVKRLVKARVADIRKAARS